MNFRIPVIQSGNDTEILSSLIADYSKVLHMVAIACAGYFQGMDRDLVQEYCAGIFAFFQIINLSADLGNNTFFVLFSVSGYFTASCPAVCL